MSAKVEVHNETVLMTRVSCEHGCEIGPNRGLFFSPITAANRAQDHRLKHECPRCGMWTWDYREQHRCNVPDCLDGELMRVIDEE